MTTNEEQIRTLIEGWAVAAHTGDLNTVVADHAADIVMFDVPPPYEGVRGIDAYRETWPPFFEWQAQGASFEIESLDITAGDDVAFAQALLKCGMPEEFVTNPQNRLRLTLGLRKENGKWVVTHEHHSFPLEITTNAEQEIRQLHERWFEGTAMKDLDGMMAAIAEDVVSYEHDAPLRYVGVQAVRDVCKRGLDAAADGVVTWDVPDLKIVVQGTIGVAWGLNHVRVELTDGTSVDTWSRGTRVFERRNGEWLMIHQHLSYPYEPDTGEAKTDLRP